MGKIRKQFSQQKHGATLSPFTSAFIKSAETLPLVELPAHFTSFPNRWPFSRGDLYHWIEVLNRFDSILEQFTTAYGLSDGPQTREFTREILLKGDERDSSSSLMVSDDTLDNLGFSADGDRELVEAILTFTILLFENCGNRSLYASSSRLTPLLNTVSLSLLEATLRLGYRLAQRYTASRLRMGGPQYHLGPVNQTLLIAHYDVDVSMIQTIAQPISRMAMTNEEGAISASFPAVEQLLKFMANPDAADDQGRYPLGEYRNELESIFKSDASEPVNDFSVLSSAAEVHSSIPTLDLLKDLLHGDKAEQFSILHYIRSARALHGSYESKFQILSIRLLALANLFQIWPEEELQAHVFNKERALPRELQLPQLLCDLISPPSSNTLTVPKSIQSLAFVVLESLTHHKSKSAEVCTALNISVSHGILATTVRKAASEIVSEQDEPESDEDLRWLDNLFVLLHALPKASGRAVDGLVSAGLVDMLIEIVAARTRKAERNQAIAVNFLSAFVYNTKDAFDALINSQGLDAISQLLSHEIDLSLSLTAEGKGMPLEYKNKMNDYEVPFIQQQCLRALFKFVNSMLNISGGPIDRLLRNLVESSHVLTGLRTVLGHPNVYGSNVWTGAINIFSNFINNEPTSYAAIAEAGLTTALLKTVTREPIPVVDASSSERPSPTKILPAIISAKTVQGILPACESIHALPDAFGAICLNEGGMSQFETSGALETFFEIFTSPPHVKVLSNTSGTEIEHLGQSFDQLARHHPRLKPKITELVFTTSTRVGRLVQSASINGFLQDDMEEIMSGQDQISPSGDVEMKDANDDPGYSSTATSVYISVYSKFLSSLFRNQSMCASFTERGGIESVLAYATAPKPPLSALSGRSALPCMHRLSRVVHLLAELKPHLLLPALISRAQLYADKLQPLVDYAPSSSFLAPFITLTGPTLIENPETLQRAEVIRALEPFQMLCDLLSKSLTPNPSRASASVLLLSVNVGDMFIGLIDSLNLLLRRLLLEKQIILDLPHSDGMYMSLDEIEKKQRVTVAQSNGDTVSNHEEDASNTLKQNISGLAALDNETIFTASNTAFSIPDTIRSLFQAIAKALIPRRMHSETYSKQSMVMVASHIAQALIDLLALNNPFNAAPEAIILYSNDNTRAVSQVILPAHYEDNGRAQVRTAVLLCFKEKGGLALMGAHAKMLFEQCIAPQQGDETVERCKSRQLEANGCLREFLNIFAQIVDEHKIQDALQTGALMSRPERERDRADFFSPYHFLVELRSQTMKAVSDIWTSQDLEKCQSLTVRALSGIVQAVLEGSGELNSFGRGENMGSRGKGPPKRWRPRNDQLRSLEDRGFNRSLACEALYRCSDTLPAAEEYCTYYNRSFLRRHPIPASEMHATPPSETHGSILQSSQDENNLATQPDGPRPPTPLPSVNELVSGIPAAQSSGELSPQPTAFIDALSDIARTILQDPEGSNFPAEVNPSPPPQLQDGNFTKAEGLQDTITIEQLDDQRSAIREDIIPRCLSILSAFDDITFEMATLMIASISKAPDPLAMRVDISGTLVMSLESYQGSEDSQAEAKKIASTAHLLGIILQEKGFFEAAQESLRDTFPSLLGFLSVSQHQNLDEQSPWIPQILLIVERTLAEDMLPSQIRWEPPTSDPSSDQQPIAELSEPMLSMESRLKLFNCIIDMLPKVGKNLDLGLAIIRVLVALTRARQCATTLAQKRNMQRFLVMIKQLAPVMNDKLRSGVMLVLRNIVEDEESIRQLMRSEIRHMFEKSTRPVDTTTYTRSLYYCVMRAPEIFVEMTNELLELAKFDRNQSPQNLTLKKKDPVAKPEDIVTQEEADGLVEQEEIKLSAETGDASLEKLKATEIKAPIVENPDGVVHFLLSEILTYKEVEDKKPQPDPDAQSGSHVDPQVDVDMSLGGQAEHDLSAALDKASTVKDHFKAEDHPIYVYRCFLLQCLTELLSSYHRSKIEFINFSRKADPQATTPAKPRSGVLNYLLNALLPTGTLQHANDDDSKKKSETSQCAINVIVSLCARTSEYGPLKRRDPGAAEDEPELLFVRRFVLEHALKAFKDAIASSEPTDVRFSKILAIALLFDNMLAGKQQSPPAYRRHDSRDASLVPTQKELAKIMFEKNFIAALTGCISEIDHSMPDSDRVVKHILRPLKLLTHTAVELSLSSDISVLRGGVAVEDEISSASSVSEMDDGREETPDLYRNSTLGMFEPGREDESSSDSAGDEDEDEIYADEMVYDEVEPEPDDGDVVSDEDEEMVGVGPIEGLPGDIGMDIELEIDDGEEESEDDEDDDNEEDSEAEDDEDDDSEDGDEDEEIEIMEEIMGDDENDSLHDGDHEVGEWRDDEADGPDFDFEEPAEGPDGDAAMMDLLGGVHAQHLLAAHIPAFDVDESHSEEEVVGQVDLNVDHGEPHGLHEHLEMHMDPDEEPENEDAIEEFSAAEEEDDEEDEYDEEEAAYREFPDLEDEDSEMLPYVSIRPPAPTLRQSHRHPLVNRSFAGPRQLDRERFQDPWRRPTRPGAASIDDGINPLLNRARQEANTQSNGHTGGVSGRHLSLPPELELMHHVIQPSMDLGPGEEAANFLSGARGWVNGAENYISGLLSALQRNGPAGLMAQHHHHHHHHHHLPPLPAAVTFRMGGGPAPNGQGPTDMMEILLSHSGTPGRPRITPPTGRITSSRSDPAQAVLFTAALTMERWQEEARLIFGPSCTEKSTRVINSILRLLVPPAIEAERVRKQKAEKEAQEKKEREAEQVRREVVKEAEERREREERNREALERAEAEAAASRERELQRTNNEVPAEVMEGVETAHDETAVVELEEAPAVPVERMFTTIRGRQVDITELGIDQTFLEELPEDVREEVIMQQFAEQRSHAATSGEERADLNPQFLEFLEAVPAEIREELLQQEAQDRRRREREEARRRAAANTGQSAQADDMDAASFMASLDPILRQSVLAEADEDTLANLPAELAAEARALGGHHRRRLDPRLLAGVGSMRAQHRRVVETLNRAVDGAGRTTRRPIVQMFDRSGIATLLRLMFTPALGTNQSSLHGILRDACGNHQTRAEIVSGLLGILQDGSVDISSIDKSFLQLTQRARQGPASKVPPPVKKPPALPWTTETAPPPVQVIGSCLGALIFLTQSIPHIPKFFLTEHEVSKSKSKGKGKAKDTRSARFPVNDLLSLLGRESVLTNTPIMELVANLLQIVTHPLNALLKKEKEEPADVTQQVQGVDQLATGQAEESVGLSTANAHPEASSAEAASENLTNVIPSNGQQGDSADAPGPSSSNAMNVDPPEPMKAGEKRHEQKKPFEPPEIPEENLQLVINILTARDCGGKPFRDTLSTINNLSAIPKAREAFGHELVKRARDLGQSIQEELQKLTKDIQDAGNEIEAQNLALTKFSPTGSDQAKLNRILTALDYLFDTKAAENKNMSNEQSASLREEGNGLLTSLYEDITFSDVWNRLSACLSATRKALTNSQQSEKQSDQFFLHIASILLPLIESLMVVCKRLAYNNPRVVDAGLVASAPSTPAPESVIRNIFFSFTNSHKKILNDLVRQNPKLMSGSFSVLVKNSSVLEFDNKRNFFNRRLHHRAMDARHYPHPSLQLSVRRDQAFQDSYKALWFKKPEEIKYGKLNIRFNNEEGVDAGGVTREWFQVLARQMFDPNNALFNPVAADQTTFHPNPLSSINEFHLEYFKFIGRLIGKALYENRVLDCHFSRAVYKRILGKSVSMKDMETIDLDYTKSLQWMLDNDISDILTETFSITTDKFGVTEVVDLIENGRNIPVTDINKHEYVRLMVEHKLTGSVKDQLQSFLQGFHDIVPTELISIFDEGELELLISGMPEVDVDDWKANTDYHNYNASSPQIQWFWRAVRSFDKEERAKLLQFVTGTGKVPLNGFKELEGMNGYTRFSVHKDYGPKDRLPSSHTCFNQLDLPEYENYESLRKSLYTAMTTGGEYFGFA